MSNLAIIKPIISEKSFASAGKGVYVFQVVNSANKKIIASQVHELFKVDVVSVNIINISGKVKKAGRKTGKRSDIKKALVKIKPGQKILIFEAEEDKKSQNSKIPTGSANARKDQNDNAKSKNEKNDSDNKK